MHHVAEFLRQTRKEKNLTQLEVAQAANTTAQFICLVEKSKSKLPIHMAKKITEKLKLNRTAIRKAYEADYTNEFVNEWTESV